MSMDLDADADLSLKIPLKSVYEEFSCPICFNTITDCFMTPCGHKFCKQCIEECLNMKHSCPCCNAAVTVKQLYKDLQHDRLVSILNTEKDIASKKYFEKLIVKGNKPEKPQQQEQQQLLSPIESLFHRYLKKSLGSYNEYLKTLQVKYEQTKSNMKDEESLSQLETSYKGSTQLLMSAYETYLSSISPSPEFLPVSVNISIPSKNIVFKKVLIKVTDNLQDIRHFIENKLKESGDPLTSWTPENWFVIKRPVDIIEQPIQDELRPLIQYDIPQNSELVVMGTLKLKSNMPKQCFCHTYDKDKEQLQDYFTCKNCKINWICSACAKECHKNHEIVDYVQKHKPTWACCYCKKSKQCTLLNSQ